MYFILIPIAIAALLYKSYLHEKIEGEPFADIYAITGLVTFKHFLPLRKEDFAPEKSRAIRKANISLAVFWVCFALTILIVLVEALLKSA